MTCPECNGYSKVVDNVEINGTMHRKRKCIDCGHNFYTAEIEVNYKRIKDNWNANHRMSPSNQARRKIS